MAGRGGIICAGNWIVDIIHDIPEWPAKSDLVAITRQTVGVGGGAANVAFDLAGLKTGYPVLPVGLLGQDEHGETVLRHCRAAGLRVDYLKSVPELRTAHTHVMNVPGDSRTFFYHPGANAHLSVDHLPLGAVAAQGALIFYLGYLNLLPLLDGVGADGRTGAANVMAQARRMGMLTCVDLVSSLNESYRPTVFGTLPEIDWLFLNETEAARATAVPLEGEVDRENMALAASRLMEGGLRQGCVLHTPRLSLWKTSDQELWFDVPQIPKSEIISPVGAGDAFAAGILHGLHESWPAEDCIQLGNKMAAACLRSPTATGGIPALNEL
jgi:sugar/nucleoside kinase (ribokinase family)